MSLLKNAFSILGKTVQQYRQFHMLTQISSSPAPLSTSWSLTAVRTNIRENLPRPKETKRIKVHGWRARLSTKGGRRIIMRRILKGRHVLSH